MMEEPDENRLDHSLREKFEDFTLPPGSKVWAGIETRLEGAPMPALRKRRRPVPLPLLFALTALLAGLLGWLLPRHAGTQAARPATVATKVVRGDASPARNGRTANSQPASAAISRARPAARQTSPSQRPVPALTGNQALLRHILAEKKAAQPAAVSGLQPEEKSAVKAAMLPPAAGMAAAVQATSSPALEPAAPTDAGPSPATAATIAQASSEPIPFTLRTLVALERQTLTQLPSIATLAPGTPPAGSHAALLSNLRAQRAELQRLQRRTDSTLLALGDLPSAPKSAAAIPAPVDTARARPLSRRWSLLLAAAPEQNTLALQGPEGDSLTALRRNHETGRAGVNAMLLGEYRLTPRLSVGGGVGYSTFGADLRITNKNTEISVKYDTTTTRTTRFYTSTNRTFSIRIVQVPQLSPIFNSSGQIIGYNTVYVPRRDTVFTTTVLRDSVHSISRTVTPLISKKETISTKLLQPNYRFFTVPVLLRYRLTTGPGRWWADVAAGAQLQLFLGGTQVVTEDGENFRTESIGAGSGPFRPLNVALSGSLALNYALTNRLSVSVAPSLRWQALSVYKPETGLRQQPTATGLLFGVRFGL